MDITYFNNDKTVFNYRTCAVIIDEERLLLHKMKDDDFWTLIGGRVQMLESSECAIEREVKEELGESVKINRLLWTVENFFNFNDRDYHEISTIYSINLEKDSWVINQTTSFHGLEGDKLIYKWFNSEELKSLNIKPSFVKEKLTILPNTVNHIIHREA